MNETRYPRPRWWLLYLTLPLAGFLFWWIVRDTPAGGERRVLEIGAVVIVLIYVELWQRSNRLALMFHSVAYHSLEPLPEASEATQMGELQLAFDAELEPVNGFYSDFYADVVSDFYSDLVAASLEMTGARPAEIEPATGGLT